MTAAHSEVTMATRPKNEARPKPRMEYRVAYRFMGSEEQAQRARRRVVDCLRAAIVPKRHEGSAESRPVVVTEDSA